MAKSIFKKAPYVVTRLWWSFVRPITVGVRVLLIDNNQVVLVRHSYTSAWYLPGGGVKKNETPEQAIRRELHEELAATLHALELFGVYANFYEKKSDHIILFTSRTFTINQMKTGEIEEAKRFSFTELPSDISPGTSRRIAEFINAQPPLHGKW